MTTKNSHESAEVDHHKLAQAIQAVTTTVHRLRAPGGCPWDRAQTHQSLRPYLIEEAHEVLEVLDQIHSTEDVHKSSIKGAFQEELGDLLMQVLLHSEMASEAGAFQITDVIHLLNEKLIRRHPHVFGDVVLSEQDKVSNAFSVWERQKAEEKKRKASSTGSAVPSVLDGLPNSLPALQLAERTIEKVSKLGFQWKDLKGPLQKLKEELGELEAEIAAAEEKGLKQIDLEHQEKLEAELGDLLFSIVNVGTFIGVHAEDALRTTVKRFGTRFRHVEQRMADTGKDWASTSLEEMDRFWEEAKKNKP